MQAPLATDTAVPEPEKIEVPEPGRDAALEATAAAAKERKPGAFDALAARIAPRLMAYADGILRDRGLAEEAVQEALIRVYRFLPSYHEKNFLAWCLTITNRACSNLIRRERRHSKLRLVVRGGESADPTHAVGSRLAIEAALASLPVQLRQTFLLHEQGLSYEEVGAVLDIAVGTVRSRLFRARDALRASLRAGDDAAAGDERKHSK